MTLSDMHKKVLITGVTGFLGSRLAVFFLDHNYSVVGLKRLSSNTWRCKEFSERILWIDVDKNDWQQQAAELQPDVIIHTAWEGVTASERYDLHQQLKNLYLTSDLLAVAKKAGTRQFIGLGSQAEYGKLNKIASEEDAIVTETAYGIVKVMASKMIELFCQANNIHWYWLRIFSIFGEMQGEQWLIPSIVKKMLTNEDEIAFSEGSQKYAYMYAGDFVKAVHSISERTEIPVSGIYNVSGGQAMTIRNLVEKVKDLCGSSKVHLNFGKLPFHPAQSMHIEGSTMKFSTNVAPISSTDMDTSLERTINYYKKMYRNID